MSQLLNRQTPSPQLAEEEIQDSLRDLGRDLGVDGGTAAELKPVLDFCLQVGGQSQRHKEAVLAGLDMVRELIPAGGANEMLAAACLYWLHEEQLISDAQKSAVASAQVLALMAEVSSQAEMHKSVDDFRRQWRQADQLERLRNMVLAMSDDLRVTLLLLAERSTRLQRALQRGENCRTSARHLLRIYAPIAERLGFHRLKSRMEDLCLFALAPHQATRISSRVEELRDEWESAIAGLRDTLAGALKEEGIACTVESRVKNIYGIWRKMRSKGVGFDGMHDVLGVRIIVEGDADCYRALGSVHALWSHLSDEFDDYIGNPKPSGYRSIHTAVVVPRVGTLEVQIRSKEMDKEAEFGACAHWLYKGDSMTNPWFEERVRQLRKLAENTAGNGDRPEASYLTRILIDDSMRRHIYVFTRNGDPAELPTGATVLDLAYYLHSDLGVRCVGGIVNGVRVPAAQMLRNGQRVEIISGPEREPEPSWLQSPALQTSRAKHKLQQRLRRLENDRARTEGERLLVQELSVRGLNVTAMHGVASELEKDTVDQMLLDLGTGRLQLDIVRGAIDSLSHQESWTQKDPKSDNKPE